MTISPHPSDSESDPTPSAEIEAVTERLMSAMKCKVENDIPEGPCCEFPPACRGHERTYYCVEHDWHEDDNTTEGVCGYALMLARAALSRPLPDGRAS